MLRVAPRQPEEKKKHHRAKKEKKHKKHKKDHDASDDGGTTTDGGESGGDGHTLDVHGFHKKHKNHKKVYKHEHLNDPNHVAVDFEFNNPNTIKENEVSSPPGILHNSTSKKSKKSLK